MPGTPRRLAHPKTEGEKKDQGEKDIQMDQYTLDTIGEMEYEAFYLSSPSVEISLPLPVGPSPQPWLYQQSFSEAAALVS